MYGYIWNMMTYIRLIQGLLNETLSAAYYKTMFERVISKFYLYFATMWIDITDYSWVKTFIYYTLDELVMGNLRIPIKIITCMTLSIV